MKETHLVLADGSDVVVKPDDPLRQVAGLEVSNSTKSVLFKNTSENPCDFQYAWGRYERGTWPIIEDSRPVGGDVWSIIDTDAPSHRIYPGECLIIPHAWAGAVGDSPQRAAKHLGKEYDTELIEKWPLMEKVISNYRQCDDYREWEGTRTQAWMNYEENYHRRYGGSKIVHGWRHAGGEPHGYVFNQRHYNIGDGNFIYHMTKEIGTSPPLLEGYTYGMAGMLQMAGMGLFWSGSNLGQWLTEKGDYRRGNGGWSRAKQFTSQLISWATLCPHAFLDEAVLMRGEGALRTQDWNGLWGARIGAWILECLRLCYEYTGDDRYRQDLIRRCRATMALNTRDPGTGIWLNGNYAVSPWMNAKLVIALLRAKQHGWMEGNELAYMADLIRTAKSIMMHGTYRTGAEGQYGACRYRFQAPIGNPGNDHTHSTHPDLSAWIIPLLKMLIHEVPQEADVWRQELEAFELTCFGLIGHGWSSVGGSPYRGPVPAEPVDPGPPVDPDPPDPEPEPEPPEIPPECQKWFQDWKKATGCDHELALKAGEDPEDKTVLQRALRKARRQSTGAGLDHKVLAECCAIGGELAKLPENMPQMTCFDDEGNPAPEDGITTWGMEEGYCDDAMVPEYRLLDGGSSIRNNFPVPMDPEDLWYDHAPYGTARPKIFASFVNGLRTATAVEGSY